MVKSHLRSVRDGVGNDPLLPIFLDNFVPMIFGDSLGAGFVSNFQLIVFGSLIIFDS